MKKIIYLLSILTILFVGLFSTNVANASDDKEYIVLFKDIANVSVSSQNRVNSNVVESLKGKVVRDLDNIPAMTVLMSENEMQELKAKKEVAAVEENIQVKLSTQSLDWGIGTVKAQTAWSSGYTGDGVKVAVLDSGIKAHSDLIIKGGVDLVPNTIDGVTSYSDSFGHGTFVAGIIGGLNNTIGYVGVAPDADLFAVKVFYNGTTNLDLILSGIDWCIDNNMDIVNMSFGSPDDSPAYKALIQTAYANDLILVAATGNDDNGLHNTDTVNYPAKYDEVIGVSAIDKTNKIADFASTGAKVEITAPGVDVVSTNINNSYSIGSGTSFASPYVSGVLALYKECYPDATNSQIRQKLIDNATDLGVAGRDDLYGYGLIQSPKNISEELVGYRSYVQSYGYQPWKIDGAISGITGKSLRMETWMLKLGTKMTEGTLTGSRIKYRSYIEGSGWEDWKLNGVQSGITTDKLERINISLDGAIATKYDVYYSVHVQDVGWMGWAKNGANAGTSGYGYRIEAMKVVLVAKGAAAPGTTTNSYKDKTNDAVSYRSYVQSNGYQPWKMDGAVSGITGKSLRMEAWMLKLGIKMTEGTLTGSSIKYRSYIDGSGWEDWKINGTQSGVVNKKVETINISLDGPIAAKYDVYYSVHVQNIGWMGWAKNGANAGTSGYGYRIEAMKVVLVNKGAAAPGSTANAYKDLSNVDFAYMSYVQSYGYQPWKTSGEISGITGKSLRMEAWMMKLGTKMTAGDLAGSSIKYRSYVEGSGWQDWKVNGAQSGEINKRIETVNISLDGPIAAKYDVYYSVHVQNIGWMGWAKNGANGGTTGYGYRIEAIKVVLVAKGSSAPGSTAGAYRQK